MNILSYESMKVNVAAWARLIMTWLCGDSTPHTQILWGFGGKSPRWGSVYFLSCQRRVLGFCWITSNNIAGMAIIGPIEMAMKTTVKTTTMPLS